MMPSRIELPNLYYNDSIAFCFMVTKDLSKENVWKKWLNELNKLNVKYNIYVHVSDPTKVKSDWLKKYLIPQNIPTWWDDHMDAELTLLKYALDNSNDSWFINLSETTIPMVSPSKFKKMFNNYKNKTILQYKKIWWDPRFQDRGNSLKFPPKARLGNSEWCSICNEDMRVICYMWKNTNIINTIMKKPHADESIFSVSLYIGNRFKNTINAFNTLMDWERDLEASSPYTFKYPYTEYDKKFIEEFLKKNKYVMFMRKVDSTFPDKIIYSWLKIK
jgi:hypothetical protein